MRLGEALCDLDPIGLDVGRGDADQPAPALLDAA
jgi:hypothetical protein